MKNFYAFTIMLLVCANAAEAQDIHFSQYYNTPMMQNVGNTGLMSDYDYRATAIYRTQWASVPAPFTTIGLTGEFQLLRNNEYTNWLGVGFRGVSDKAGDGELSYQAVGTSLAYHILLGKKNLLSFGMGIDYVRRSVDFAKLSYDVQWDGYTFNKSLPNGEYRAFERNDYVNISSGINYSFFPSEMLYFKLGVGVDHINMPISTLIAGNQKLGIRPIVTTDAIIGIQNGYYIRPSAYFTYMQKASQAVAGVTVSKELNKMQDHNVILHLGVHHRLMESVIGSFGMNYKNFLLTFSYDYTVSSFRKANSGNGAFEVSLIFQGGYNGGNSRIGKTPFECPRF